MTFLIVYAILTASQEIAHIRVSPIEVPVGRRQLFLDNYCLARIEGLRSTMHSPDKRRAVIKPDVNSDGSRIQTYGSIPMWSPEERLFKMVYMAFPMENHGEIGAALAVSKDGIHWEKPDLGQGITVRGSTNNNRIFVDRGLSWGNNAFWNVIESARRQSIRGSSNFLTDRNSSRRVGPWCGKTSCGFTIPVSRSEFPRIQGTQTAAHGISQR